MANNVPALKAAIKTAFTNNLDAATRSALLNRFTVRYSNEWARDLANGTFPNTNAGKADFAMDRLFDFIDFVYQDGSVKEQTAAIVAEKIS